MSRFDPGALVRELAGAFRMMVVAVHLPGGGRMEEAVFVGHARVQT